MSTPRRNVLLRVIARGWSNSAVRYLLVGGMAFLIDIGLLAILHELIGVPLVAATPTAFLTSFGVTYLLQRTITFDGMSAWGPSAVKYTLLVVFNAFATTAIVSGIDAMGLTWEIGKVAAVTATTVWNYFAYRYWVFTERR